MLKPFTLALTLALFVSCGKKSSGGQDASEEVINLGSVEITPDTPTPEAAITFKTNGVNYIGSMTSSQVRKFDKALEVVRLVITTNEFKNRVLNHKYNGKKQFANNNGLTNSQIYKAILEAAETFKRAKNNTMDMGVELYTASNTVVGYTYPSSTQIWVNTKYFNMYTAAGVAHNLVHEWLHKLGYGHDASSTARRPYSVPYAIGYIVKDIGQDFL
jgi:ssRNA-specific RNase YbeY (16S rRNA maturation enzyme)